MAATGSRTCRTAQSRCRTRGQDEGAAVGAIGDEDELAAAGSSSISESRLLAWGDDTNGRVLPMIRAKAASAPARTRLCSVKKS